MIYADTINANGSFNAAAIMALAWAKARAERNAALCNSRGIRASEARVPCSLVNEFYAREAAKIAIPGYVGMVSNYLGRELRAVWRVAHELKAASVAAPIEQPHKIAA